MGEEKAIKGVGEEKAVEGAGVEKAVRKSQTQTQKLKKRLKIFAKGFFTVSPSKVGLI